MDIYKADGSKWMENVPITSSCEKREELMACDYIKLAWDSDKDDIIPMGAFIIYKYPDGSEERYTLAEPYSPIAKNERCWRYEPEFQSRTMLWGNIPFFLYTKTDTTTKETDWSLTDTPENFLRAITDAIYNETKERWTFAVGSSLDPSATVSFSDISILSALASIASAFDTEYWFEKKSSIIHLSKAINGDGTTLEVGNNVGAPSVTRQGKYYNRFYIFGSTRNIEQDYKGSQVNNIINKRLTLNPTTYPNGYLDYSEGGPVSSCVLYFDDIYPSARGIFVSNIVTRRRYVLDDISGGKIELGTDSSGNIIYDTYTIYYIQLSYTNESGKVVPFPFNNSTYDEEDNPSGMLIKGKNLTCHFLSGQLQGREFEVTYHKTSETLSSIDGDVVIPDDCYELNYIKEGDYIIPASSVIIPALNDKVGLVNCKMPEAYVTDAQNRLYQEAVKLINAEYLDTETGVPVDHNQYEVKSYPHCFRLLNSGLYVGEKVLFIHNDKTLATRVLGITVSLEHFEQQTITIGNQKRKGSIEELREIASENEENRKADRKYSESIGQRGSRFTSRSLEDAEETFGALIDAKFENYDPAITPIAIKTMQLIAGDKSLQFLLYPTYNGSRPINPYVYDNDTKQLSWSTHYLRHMTLGQEDISLGRTYSSYYKWRITAGSTSAFSVPEKMYYVYVKGKYYTTGSYSTNTEVICTDTAIGFTEVSNYYHFLIGILSSEKNGVRSFTTLYGFTEILGGQITTRTIKSSDGNSFWDLLGQEFKIGNAIHYIDGKLTITGTILQQGTGDEAQVTVFRGAYDPSMTYHNGDEVTYEVGGILSTYRYVNSVSSSGNAPTNETYWVLVAKGGRPGADGQPGKDGEPGKDGQPGKDGEPGKDAQTIVKSFIFKRGASGSVSTPSGGTFSSPMPSPLDGWSDGVPSSTDSEDLVYMSTRIFTSDGKSPQQSSWTKPQPISDATDIAFLWSESVTEPANPSTSMETWSATATSESVWMAMRKLSMGLWGDWVVVKIKGEAGADGSDGPSLVYRGEYSADKVYYGTSTQINAVKYNGIYYVTLTPNQAGLPSRKESWSNIAPTNTAYWAVYGAQFESVATDLLLADTAAIRDLTVNKVRTSNEADGTKVVIEGNEMMMYDTDGALKMRVHGNNLSSDSGSSSSGSIVGYSKSETSSVIPAESTVYNYNCGTLATFSVNENNKVTFSSFNATALLTVGTGQPSREVTLYLTIYVDGVPVASGSSSGNNGTSTLISSFDRSFTAGTHIVTASATIVISNGSQTTASMAFNLRTSSYSIIHYQEFVEVAKNGLRAIFGTTQYRASFARESGDVKLLLVAGDYGVKVSPSSLRVKIGGSWYSLSISSGTVKATSVTDSD